MSLSLVMQLNVEFQLYFKIHVTSASSMTQVLEYSLRYSIQR